MSQILERLRYAPPAFWRCVMVCGVALAVLYSLAAQARDPDGRYANSPYKQWFDSQRDANGNSCCLEADAHRYDGGYSFNADGSVTLDTNPPHTLPAEKVLKGSNPTGSAIWWYSAGNGWHMDYCFAPGTLS